MNANANAAAAEDAKKKLDFLLKQLKESIGNSGFNGAYDELKEFLAKDDTKAAAWAPRRSPRASSRPPRLRRFPRNRRRQRTWRRSPIAWTRLEKDWAEAQPKMPITDSPGERDRTLEQIGRDLEMLRLVT